MSQYSSVIPPLEDRLKRRKGARSRVKAGTGVATAQDIQDVVAEDMAVSKRASAGRVATKRQAQRDPFAGADSSGKFGPVVEGALDTIRQGGYPDPRTQRVIMGVPGVPEAMKAAAQQRAATARRSVHGGSLGPGGAYATSQPGQRPTPQQLADAAYEREVKQRAFLQTNYGVSSQKELRTARAQGRIKGKYGSNLQRPDPARSFTPAIDGVAPPTPGTATPATLPVTYDVARATPPGADWQVGQLRRTADGVTLLRDERGVMPVVWSNETRGYVDRDAYINRLGQTRPELAPEINRVRRIEAALARARDGGDFTRDEMEDMQGRLDVEKTQLAMRYRLIAPVASQLQAEQVQAVKQQEAQGKIDEKQRGEDAKRADSEQKEYRDAVRDRQKFIAGELAKFAAGKEGKTPDDTTIRKHRKRLEEFYPEPTPPGFDDEGQQAEPAAAPAGGKPPATKPMIPADPAKAKQFIDDKLREFKAQNPTGSAAQFREWFQQQGYSR